MPCERERGEKQRFQVSAPLCRVPASEVTFGFNRIKHVLDPAPQSGGLR
jgi:hypothetical protein